jgi:serine/threonine-protein kinase RsbW
MTETDRAPVRIRIPADVAYFRSVRLAVGALAAMVGFDVEAIDDLRIGIDELCATASEAGDGADLVIDIHPQVGSGIRIEATTTRGTVDPDPARFGFSRRILSVVADDFGYEAGDSQVRCWIVRELVAAQLDAAGGA